MKGQVYILPANKVASSMSTPGMNNKELIQQKNRQDSSLNIQFKLTVGAAKGSLENEADNMADKVMRMPEQNFIHRKSAHCEEEEKAQRKPLASFIQKKQSSTNNSVVANDNISNKIQSTKGGGNAMHETTKSFMESRFDTDFSNVKIHTGGYASQLSKELSAQAFTVGNDIYFNEGKYQPESSSGKHLLAHELTHTIQQKAVGFKVQKTPFTIGRGRHAMHFQSGNLKFEAAAKADMLRNGSLLPSQDQAHIAFHGDLLGYDINYAQPTDPFRWEKLKVIINSNGKIIVKKTSIAGQIDTLFVTPSGKRIIQDIMRSLGLTLITESLNLSIFPSDTTYVVSPIVDTHIVYYTADINTPADSSLAHELLGHLWLAIKRVPYVHPSQQPALGTHGTLSAQHGVLDPFGNIYTGTVQNFINTYIGSESGTLNSPTQNVGIQLYQQALVDFKTLFVSGSTGTLNQSWSVSPAAYRQWNIISGNYVVAPSQIAPATLASQPPATTPQSSTINRISINNDIVTWYNSISIDKRYVFWKMLEQDQLQMNNRSALATNLLSVLIRPPGMI